MGKKIVLDTNVFVSALGWKGASREIFKGCIDGDLALFISTEIFYPQRILQKRKMHKSTVPSGTKHW